MCHWYKCQSLDMIFGVLWDDTLPPYPEEESGHCSPSTPSNAGQGVLSLHGSCRGFCFCEWKTNPAIPSFPFSACCCFCYVYLGLLWFLATSPFSLCWGPPSCREIICADGSLCLCSAQVHLNLPYVFTQKFCFQGAFLSHPKLNCSPLPNPVSPPSPKHLLSSPCSVYLFLLFVDLLLTLPS